MLISDIKTKASKSIEFLNTELSQIRTGRASPSIIENVMVDAYDSKMSVKELASITVIDSQNLVVSAWDKSLLKSISKAIRESGLGLNPIDDVDKIRIPVPSLSEERRVELTKTVSSKVEECKNSIRNIRQEAMKDIEKDFSEKKIGEDDKYSQKEAVEKTIKEIIEQAENIGNKKKEELLKI
ncbi:MAG TPA: ribosome recycling factor [bacterium]|nr:ribosome recycling factor [bacterium]HOA18272.1 ribosome recycling factor [bacterium]